MRTPARIRIAVSLLAASFAAACSDSTGPSQPTAAQLATHFDSIAVRAAAQSDTNSAYGVRGLIATLIEVPASLGASPANVSVTTAGGVESWKAYELLELAAPGSSNDSTFILLMFRDKDAHDALVVFFDGSGNASDGALIAGDTIGVSPSAGDASTSLFSVGSACSTPSSSLHNPQLSSVLIGTCAFANFHTTVSLTLPAHTGVDAALTSLVFTNSTVNGVRVVDAATGAALRHAQATLRTMKASTRF